MKRVSAKIAVLLFFAAALSFIGGAQFVYESKDTEKLLENYTIVDTILIQDSVYFVTFESGLSSNIDKPVLDLIAQDPSGYAAVRSVELAASGHSCFVIAGVLLVVLGLYLLYCVTLKK